MDGVEQKHRGADDWVIERCSTRWDWRMRMDCVSKDSGAERYEAMMCSGSCESGMIKIQSRN